MIITEQKPFEEVNRYLEGFSKVFIFGCKNCASVCQTGGEEQVKDMAHRLVGKEVLGFSIVETPCDKRLLRLELIRDKLWMDAEAILVMACGIGAQSIFELTGKVCIPALNTRFIGITEKIGAYYQRCAACGDCILAETGGICPIARCPKGLLNGPCAGYMQGKCEVDPNKDCAWILIYRRLRDLGQLHKLREFRKPRNFKVTTAPQEVVWR